MTQQITSLRPSTLPKMAECPGFTNSPFKAGPPAMRGNITDEGYRDYFDIGEDAPNFVNMDQRIAALSEECGVDLAPAKAGHELYTRLDRDRWFTFGSQLLGFSITLEDRFQPRKRPEARQG